jgi:hypothetical protein
MLGDEDPSHDEPNPDNNENAPDAHLHLTIPHDHRVDDAADGITR